MDASSYLPLAMFIFTVDIMAHTHTKITNSESYINILLQFYCCPL